MTIVMQHTNLGASVPVDIFVHDDDSVTDVNSGDPYPSAIVSHVIVNDSDTLRVDINGNGLIDINPVPALCTLRVERNPTAAICYLDDLSPDADPTLIRIREYAEEAGEGGVVRVSDAFELNPDTGEWSVVFGMAGETTYLGMDYDGAGFSAFTMRDIWQEMSFSAGGDWATGVIIGIIDLDNDGLYDTHIADLAGGGQVTVDADSVNIDLTGDDKADVILPI